MNSLDSLSLTYRQACAREQFEEASGLLRAVADIPHSADVKADSLGEMYRHACFIGKSKEANALLDVAGRIRPKTGDLRELRKGLQFATFADGPERPGLFCFTSFAALAGAHQYARLGAGFDGIRDLTVLTAPGYAEGELLPDTFDAALELHAQAILQRHPGGEPFVLAGASGGGFWAQAVAASLEERHGVSPAAVVLVDTYSPDPSNAEPLKLIGPGILRSGLERSRAVGYLDSVGLTALGWYLRLFSRSWTPVKVAAPTLLIRATEFLPGELGEAPSPAAGLWQPSGNFADCVLDGLGNHFSIMGDHATSTARIIHDWLGEVVAPGEQRG